VDDRVGDADRHQLGERGAAKEVVEAGPRHRYPSAGEQSQCRCPVARLVPWEVPAGVGRVGRLAVHEVPLQVGAEVERESGVAGVVPCIEDADANAATLTRIAGPFASGS
jgi:hypothetical protein